jgi:phosphate:Na+ symporter
MQASNFFLLFGGLALFIYGMIQMGEALQKAAGESMRRILQLLTSNPLIGVVVGMAVTMIIQSSSATTVMVIGFVSAGLMTLRQSIGVIMGANIGTTITAWLVAIKIGDYAWLFAALGFLMMFIGKKAKVRYIGQLIFSFGILFIGLNTMGDSMKPLVKNAFFLSLMEKSSQYPILGLLMGTLFTSIIQSSSASIGVLQTLASAADSPSSPAVIGIMQAFPLLIGANIGTTITAFLASIGARKEARRAALTHTLFNVIGAAVFMPLFYIAVKAGLERWLSSFLGVDVATAGGIRSGIASLHSIFNISNTLLLLPFIWLLVKIVSIIVPGKDAYEQRNTLYLDYKVIGTSYAALDLATKELARMAEYSRQMSLDAKKALVSRDTQAMKRILEIEDIVDLLDKEIVKYMSTMMSRKILTDHESLRVAGLMHVTSDIERIADHCTNIGESAQEVAEEGIKFSDQAIVDLEMGFDKVLDIVDKSISSLRNNDVDLAIKVIMAEGDLDNMEISLKTSHMKRLNDGLCNPKSAFIFLDVIHNMERIGDHCKNIAEAVVSDNNLDVEKLERDIAIKQP